MSSQFSTVTEDSLGCGKLVARKLPRFFHIFFTAFS